MKRYATLLAALATTTTLVTACSSSGGGGGSTAGNSSNTSSTTPASGGASSSSSLAGQTVKIVQGGGSDFSDADTYKAIALLEAQGIKVKSSVINDPSSALRAAISGQADLYLGSPDEAATAVENGDANVKYIGSTYGASSYVVLAKNNVTLQNLAGKKLAIASPGSVGQVVAIAAFTKLGVDTSKIKQVTVGGTSARVTAILAGQVDLAPALAPAAIPAVATGKVKILVNTGTTLGPYIQQGIIANGDFVKNTALAQATVNAFIDAERWAASNKTDYIALANSQKLQGDLTSAEESTAYDTLKQGNFWATNGTLCQTAIDTTLNYDYASKALDKSKMPAQTAWLDMSFVQNYLTAHSQPTTTC